MGELFDGICLLIAGALLLTPGFITDCVGFALFIPPVRMLLGTFILSRFLKSGSSRVWVNGEEVGPGGMAGGGPGGRPGRGPIIDGEYTDVTEPDEDEPGPAGRLDHRPEDRPGGDPADSPWRRDG